MELSQRLKLNYDLAKSLKGGVIMDVTTLEEAIIAERSGAIAVMALEKVPADIIKDGKIARMSDPRMIKKIENAVTIPVMAKCRIGHITEAAILQAIDVDFIDESEVLTKADCEYIDKREFTTPFVCGATNLGEALRRIEEGASMIRTKGEAGTGNIIEAVKHLKQIKKEIAALIDVKDEDISDLARDMRVSPELVKDVKENQKLPVVMFAAGGVATPADAALLMRLGADGVFVGSGIFKSSDPAKMAEAIVKATAYFEDDKLLAKISEGLPLAMEGCLPE